MLIAFLSGNELLEGLDPTEESLYRPRFLVEVSIKPERSPVLRMILALRIHRNIARDPSFSRVLPDLPGIVGCIGRNHCWLLGRARNLECCNRWGKET